MKQVYLLIYSVLLCTFLGAWKIIETNDISKAEWLIGTWENKTARGTIYESWNKVSNTEMAGKSYMIKDKDTVVFETVRLVHEEGTFFYIPTVKNQNNDLPVRFSAKSITASQLVFENQKHDFPQIISYTRIGKDSLQAEISGTINGKERKQQFNMKRMN